MLDDQIFFRMWQNLSASGSALDPTASALDPTKKKSVENHRYLAQKSVDILSIMQIF